MKHIKKNLSQALLWLMLGLVPQFTWAEVPNVINYQGYLTDSSGTPLKGTVNVTLKFWDAVAAGNMLGSAKAYTNVELNNGVFSQNVDVSDLTFDNPVFIETTVNGEVLAPRQLLNSVPFAYLAKKAMDADKLDGHDSSEFLTSETDPTVPANLKDGVSWEELSNIPPDIANGDQQGIQSETDPQVGSLSPGKWCTSNGSQINCTSNTPFTSETDPQVGSNSSNYAPKWNGSALVKGSIYDNGNIGIGTTTPNSKLQVAGTIHSTTGGIKFPDNTIQKTAASGSSGVSIDAGVTYMVNGDSYLDIHHDLNRRPKIVEISMLSHMCYSKWVDKDQDGKGVLMAHYRSSENGDSFYKSRNGKNTNEICRLERDENNIQDFEITTYSHKIRIKLGNKWGNYFSGGGMTEIAWVVQ